MIDVYEQLMAAIDEHDLSEVKRLIENGVDLNQRCDQGTSALSGAILQGNPVIVRLMLEHGADPNLLADEPAAIIYTEKPLDLALQARFLLNWDKYHPIVKLLESFGATDFDGRVPSEENLKALEIRAREWQAGRADELRHYKNFPV